MKKYTLFLVFLAILNFTARSQKESQMYMYFFNFDYWLPYSNLILDTVNQYNDWQIGQPQKTLFNQAYSPPNALVTDTIGYYRPSNVSIFTFISPTYGGTPEWPILEFYYKFDSDSLLDYGKIEVSGDHGQSWIDIVRGANLHGFGWYVDGPSSYLWTNADSINPFTGRTNGWYYFRSELFSIYHPTIPDTIMYRFSFISDAIQTNKEGWMIDDMNFFDWWEGINTHTNGDLNVRVIPNPVSRTMTIRFMNPANDLVSIRIFDSKGAKQIELNTTSDHSIINVQSLSAGLYLCKIMNIKTNQVFTGRFIKQ